MENAGALQHTAGTENAKQEKHARLAIKIAGRAS